MTTYLCRHLLAAINPLTAKDASKPVLLTLRAQPIANPTQSSSVSISSIAATPNPADALQKAGAQVAALLTLAQGAIQDAQNRRQSMQTAEGRGTDVIAVSAATGLKPAENQGKAGTGMPGAAVSPHAGPKDRDGATVQAAGIGHQTGANAAAAASKVKAPAAAKKAAAKPGEDNRTDKGRQSMSEWVFTRAGTL